jgi:hypothetical protein
MSDIMTDIDKHAQIFSEVHIERLRQDNKWGEQHHAVRRDSEASFFKYEVDTAKRRYEAYAKDGHATWFDIALEEFWEVFAEGGAKRQREELVQLIAVCVHIVEDIDYKAKEEEQAVKQGG